MLARPIVPCIAATCLALALSACGSAETPPPVAPKVLVQPAGAGDAGVTVYTGEIRARHEVDLAFRVGGKIAARLVDSGMMVKAGQPLARLDPADLQLSRQAAQAQVAAAESEFTTAGAERARYADLVAKRFVSQAAFDAKENAFRSAQARLEQARAQSRISGNQAEYGTLVAEHEGVITAVLADAGQVISAGQPVFRLARPEEKEVAIAIPEGRLAELKAARQIAVSLWAQPELVMAGEIRELAAAADPATRTYAARIRIVNPAPAVALGMTARVILGSPSSAAIVVPLTAVVDNGKGPQVWVVDDGKAMIRPVEVAAFREDGAAIASGLKAGEMVILTGQRRLVDGQAVHAQPATPPDRQR
ncbi:MAG: efflux RND transporter periplasmic adaptor subunit [Azonexus sp.]